MPWRQIKDIRTRLTHYYKGTDYEVVWNTLQRDFPAIAGYVASVREDGRFRASRPQCEITE